MVRMGKDGTKIAGLTPFGIGRVKPNHYVEMAKVFWENRDNLTYAHRILVHGVCDGCSLGPYGLKDNTLNGVHLCLTRLRMLRMNTMPALDVSVMSDLRALRRMSGEQLRNLGRLPYPMVRRKGEQGFNRISWDEAMNIAAGYIKGIDPRRFALFTTSRGLTNEVYYVAGKFTRLLGSNNVDNAARLCHAASTSALKHTIGVAASTCSYTDWLGTELIVLAGANIANNQPVSTKYLYYAKKNGARIVVVNPYREPGLEKYWIPSIAKSAVFGTRLMDDFFPITVGGDVAFYNGVLKVLIENKSLDEDFIQTHTSGFADVEQTVAGQSWEMLERHSGTTREEMRRFAELYAGVRTAIFIWSMGLTQHRFGVQNVEALVNLALARGMIGRPNVGVVPIRGHSGVQGAAEVGSVPGEYFAGMPVSEENARKVDTLWNVTETPASKGMSTPHMVEAAHESQLDAFYIIGGNFVDTMPDPQYVREALENVPLRIHQDLIVNTSMLVDPADAVLLFPSQTRYEQRGGGTVTSTERRVRYSPEIAGPRIGEARSEWEIMVDLGKHVLPPDKQKHLAFGDADELRAEMDRVIPLYRGIGELKKEGDAFQYGGERLLEGGVCSNLPDGRARFCALTPQNDVLEPGQFYLTTRRGKQFNSILYGESDPMTGSKRRDDVYLSPEDAADLKVAEGDRIVLKSDKGQYEGVCRLAPLRPRTVQMFWPEANILLTRRIDPQSHEPDYNTVVTVTRV